MPDPYLPPALFVTWQAPESRTVYPVGRLVRAARTPSFYEFAYLSAALEAQGEGFVPFTSFPELQTLYRSNVLPPFFENRIMPRSRGEFRTHLKELGLDDSASPELILARTNGRRTTDPYEVFSEFEPSEQLGEWQTWFFARSIRYLADPGAVENLKPGDQLFCMRDVQNDTDRFAIALRSEPKALVGYCPSYLTEELSRVLDKPDAVLVRVERVNSAPSPMQMRLQCHLRVRPAVPFHCYRTGRFLPLSESALQLGEWPSADRAA